MVCIQLLIPATTPALETLCCCLTDKPCKRGRGGWVRKGAMSLIKTTWKNPVFTGEGVVAQKVVPHRQMRRALRVGCSHILNSRQRWKIKGRDWTWQKRLEWIKCYRYGKGQQWQRYDGKIRLREETATADETISGRWVSESQNRGSWIVKETGLEAVDAPEGSRYRQMLTLWKPLWLLKG